MQSLHRDLWGPALYLICSYATPIGERLLPDERSFGDGVTSAVKPKDPKEVVAEQHRRESVVRSPKRGSRPTTSLGDGTGERLLLGVTSARIGSGFMDSCLVFEQSSRHQRSFC